MTSLARPSYGSGRHRHVARLGTFRLGNITPAGGVPVWCGPVAAVLEPLLRAGRILTASVSEPNLSQTARSHQVWPGFGSLTLAVRMRPDYLTRDAGTRPV